MRSGPRRRQLQRDVLDGLAGLDRERRVADENLLAVLVVAGALFLVFFFLTLEADDPGPVVLLALLPLLGRRRPRRVVLDDLPERVGGTVERAGAGRLRIAEAAEHGERQQRDDRHERGDGRTGAAPLPRLRQRRARLVHQAEHPLDELLAGCRAIATERCLELPELLRALPESPHSSPLPRRDVRAFTSSTGDERVSLQRGHELLHLRAQRVQLLRPLDRRPLLGAVGRKSEVDPQLPVPGLLVERLEKAAARSSREPALSCASPRMRSGSADHGAQVRARRASSCATAYSDASRASRAFPRGTLPRVVPIARAASTTATGARTSETPLPVAPRRRAAPMRAGRRLRGARRSSRPAAPSPSRPRHGRGRPPGRHGAGERDRPPRACRRDERHREKRRRAARGRRRRARRGSRGRASGRSAP